MKVYSFIIILLCLAGQGIAQKTAQPLGLTNTPKGIFIELRSPELARKNLELQRKKNGEAAFKTIAKLNAPVGIGDVRRKIAEAANVFEEGYRPKEDRLETVWAKYVARDKNTLELIGGIPQLQYVFSLAYLDTDVRPGEKYLYQVVEDRTVLLSTPKAFTREKLKYFPPLQGLSNSVKDRAISLEVSYPVQLFFTTIFHVSRKNIAAPVSDYKEIKPLVALPNNRKKSSVIVTDTSLTSYGDYNYMVRLSDIFGNKDTSSYYFEGNNIPQLARSEVTDVKIESVKTERALAFSWELTGKDRIQSISLYRSRSFDGKFEAIARLDKEEKTYVDQIQVANELYFYYFEVTDIFSNVWKSIKFQKVYEGLYVPTPPVDIQLKETERGPDLSWKSSDSKTRGYYVFRKKNESGEFEQVSPMILTAGGSGKFLDTTRLTSDSYYFYAVKAESDTYDQSGFSDTVSYRPKAVVRDISLKPPYDLNASYRDGKARITWENVHDTSPDVMGYQVFRKADGEKEFKLLTAKPLPYHHNYWVDSLLANATRFEYLIVSTDGRNHFGQRSSPTTLNLAGLFVLIPDEVGYEMDPKGITFKWTEVDPDRLKSIKIYRSENDGALKLITTLDRKLKKFKDITVKKGKTYIYQLSTVDLNGKESNRTEPLLLNF